MLLERLTHYQMKTLLFCLALMLALVSCGPDRDKASSHSAIATEGEVEMPVFNADSAFFFVQQQVNFGPRIPNTKAHQAAADFLVTRLTHYGAEVTVQEFESITFDNQKINLKNIIASFYPDRKKRILLAAHWDTRPFADKDKEQPNALFDGANDGGSGVGVLLEIARLLHGSEGPPVGIDIILFDGEDWGEKISSGHMPLPSHLDSWWCLGSQHWSKHKHQANYSAYYGILLDMVGAKNARFYRESLSLAYAPRIVEKVWNAAEKLGYSHIFVKKNQGELIDDHKYVNEIAKIPMIDIVGYDPATGSFGSFHHTRADNIDLIDKEILAAVGRTVLYVLYHEKPGA